MAKVAPLWRLAHRSDFEVDALQVRRFWLALQELPTSKQERDFLTSIDFSVRIAKSLGSFLGRIVPSVVI